MTTIWAAPGRVNLIGEHTDYNDGFVLPIALAQRTVVRADPLADQWWDVRSRGRSASFGTDALDVNRRVGDWAAYVAGVIWSLREAGVDVPGARLEIESDVPVGAGLSSSAALECAVLSALAELAGATIPLAESVNIARQAENEYVGAPTGILDQSAALMCQAGHALLLDCRTRQTTQVPFDPRAAGLELLVIDTRVEHQHAEGHYRLRRMACEDAAKLLGLPALRDIDDAGLDVALAALPDDTMRRRVRHVVTENARVLATVAALRAGDWARVGELFNASHASMRDDYEITVRAVDVAAAVAVDEGALGARMTGGGFGGCVLALVPVERVDAVRAAVVTAFEKDPDITRPPTCFIAQASAGAHRL